MKLIDSRLRVPPPRPAPGKVTAQSLLVQELRVTQPPAGGSEPVAEEHCWAVGLTEIEYLMVNTDFDQPV